MPLKNLKKAFYKFQLRYPNGNGYNPTIHRLIELVNKSKMSSSKICLKAGIGINSITGWRNNRRNPSLDNIQAVLKILGYKLVIRKLSASEKPKRKV